jgi:hypothetical protein
MKLTLAALILTLGSGFATAASQPHFPPEPIMAVSGATKNAWEFEVKKRIERATENACGKKDGAQQNKADMAGFDCKTGKRPTEKIMLANPVKLTDVKLPAGAWLEKSGRGVCVGEGWLIKTASGPWVGLEPTMENGEVFRLAELAKDKGCHQSGRGKK